MRWYSAIPIEFNIEIMSFTDRGDLLPGMFSLMILSNGTTSGNVRSFQRARRRCVLAQLSNLLRNKTR